MELTDAADLLEIIGLRHLQVDWNGPKAVLPLCVFRSGASVDPSADRRDGVTSLNLRRERSSLHQVNERAKVWDGHQQPGSEVP